MCAYSATTKTAQKTKYFLVLVVSVSLNSNNILPSLHCPLCNCAKLTVSVFVCLQHHHQPFNRVKTERKCSKRKNSERESNKVATRLGSSEWASGSAMKQNGKNSLMTEVLLCKKATHFRKITQLQILTQHSLRLVFLNSHHNSVANRRQFDE